MNGVVKWFNTVEKYGFIGSNDGDIFVHISDIENETELNAGDKVEFEVAELIDGRKKAIKVRLI